MIQSLINLMSLVAMINNPQDMELLARLCISEAIGMEEVREDACLSVVDTVYTRMQMGLMTDSTVYGTLEWHTVGADGWQVWQFPPWVTYGCWDGMAQWACRDGYDRQWARDLVMEYAAGRRGTCSGYAFYNSIPYGYQDCLIQAENTQFIEFFNKR